MIHAYGCVCWKSWESRKSEGKYTFFFFFFTSRGYYGSLKTHIPVTHLPSCAHGKHYGFCQAQMNLTAPIHSCDGPWHEVWIPSVCSATTNSTLSHPRFRKHRRGCCVLSCKKRHVSKSVFLHLNILQHWIVVEGKVCHFFNAKTFSYPSFYK